MSGSVWHGEHRLASVSLKVFWEIETLPALASLSIQRTTRPKSIKEAAKLKKDESFLFLACVPPTFRCFFVVFLFGEGTADG